MSNTTVTETTPAELLLNPSDPKEREILVVERGFQLAQRKANVLANSDIVPATFKGKLANCVIAMEMAERLNTGAMEIMQNLYIVHGNPAFSSKYLIAMVNRSGILDGRLRFEFVGTPGQDDHGCYAVGTDKASKQELKGSVVTVSMAKDQGWYSKNGSKWPSMTEQMLMYRAAAFWSRIYAPEATMGMDTVEERQDIREEIDITPGSEKELGSVAEMIQAKNTKSVEESENEDTTTIIDGQAEEIKEEPFGGDAIDPEAQETAPVPEEDNRPWPRLDDGFWYDSASEIYDEEKHLWGDDQPKVNANGTFRKRPAKPAQEAPAQPTDGSKSPAYDDIMKAISLSKTPSDFIAVAGMPQMAELWEGEKDLVMAQITARKEYLKNNPE